MSVPADLVEGHVLPQAFDLDVTVNTGHIAAGEVSDCYRCPWALAVREALGRRGLDLEDGEPVKVYGGHVEVYTRHLGPFIAMLGEDVQRWILAFDRGTVPAPAPIGCRLQFEPMLTFEFEQCPPPGED